MSDYFVCPHCGHNVDWDAPACPECGSDDQTGWSENTAYDGIDVYDAERTYDNHEKNGSRRSSNRRFKFAIVAVLAVILSTFVATTIPWGLYLIPLIVVVAVVAYYLMEIAPNLRSHQEKRIYESLLMRAGGDEAMVERWISYERRRTPDAEELDLMEAALYRWQRDNM